MHREQLAQRMRGRPAGKAVVADVEDTARFEVSGGEFGDGAVVVAADPGPDTMQADTVELRQVIASKQLLEAVIVEPEIAAGMARHAASVRGMGRVEIGGDVLARIGRRVDIDRNALAEAQFTVRRGFIGIIAR